MLCIVTTSAGATKQPRHIKKLEIKTMKKIIVSFSGGKTSAFMTKKLIDQYGKENIVCVFANTGAEHPETLDFVNRCDKEWGLGVIWLEAKVNHDGFGRGYGTKYHVVDYRSASRDSEPYEDVIKKFGLANMKYLHCTREMKERPITAWIKDKYKKGDYVLAIGIRADEIDRVNLFQKKTRNLVYPLADNGYRREDVEKFWHSQPFTLNIPSYLGNCVYCHKKTDRKLFTIAKENPQWFDFVIYAGKKYANVGSEHEGGRKIYRKNRTAKQIIMEANNVDFEPWRDDVQYFPNSDIDTGGGCGESCEVFSDNF